MCEPGSVFCHLWGLAKLTLIGVAYLITPHVLWILAVQVGFLVLTLTWLVRTNRSDAWKYMTLAALAALAAAILLYYWHDTERRERQTLREVDRTLNLDR